MNSPIALFIIWFARYQRAQQLRSRRYLSHPPVLGPSGSLVPRLSNSSRNRRNSRWVRSGVGWKRSM